jgi:NAD(P)-dependent dehydrogenase (short-subunit alcohol dehydrogenase family)
MGAPMELDGKVAVVTGAASGLGEAIARRLSAAGAIVVVTDIDGPRGQQVADELAKGLFLLHDVASESDWARVIATVTHHYSRLDILVNNAGITLMGSIEELSVEAFRKTLDVDLVGVFLGCKSAIPLMRAGGGGSIVNMSSTAGLKAAPYLVAYNAAKSGVTLMTKSIALHCAKSGSGIRVNSVHPGTIRTPILDKVLAQVPNPEEMAARFVSLHPIGHIGEPDDVGEMVLYLVCDRAKFITGSTMVVDGGATL